MRLHPVCHLIFLLNQFAHFFCIFIFIFVSIPLDFLTLLRSQLHQSASSTTSICSHLAWLSYLGDFSVLLFLAELSADLGFGFGCERGRKWQRLVFSCTRISGRYEQRVRSELKTISRRSGTRKSRLYVHFSHTVCTNRDL